MKENVENELTEKFERFLTEEIELPVWPEPDDFVLPGTKAELMADGPEKIEVLNAARNSGGVFFVEVIPGAYAVSTKIKGKWGTAVKISSVEQHDDGAGMSLVVNTEGVCRVKVKGETTSEDDVEIVRVNPLADKELSAEEGAAGEVMRKNILGKIKAFAKKDKIHMSSGITPKKLSGMKNPEFFAFMTADYFDFDIDDQVRLLAMEDSMERLNLLQVMVAEAIEFKLLDDKINKMTFGVLSKQKREIYLREKQHVISEELGDTDEQDFRDLSEKFLAQKVFMDKDTAEKIEKEMKTLRRYNPASPDYQVMHTHLDFLLNLPWKHEYNDDKTAADDIDLAKIKAKLDQDHYGLEKVKDRIVELMAVKTMKKATATSIICLYGPPGTGKTSIASSIAEALGRKYVRISLGGVRDEAEIRGHRKTYIGAMPGRIMAAVEKSKTSNPLILLDEIDKLCSDFRGDPGAALLEVLDPEQNKTFMDSYADVPYDLSEVLFITTANSLETIPSPLLDRMEVIELSSYTEDEKFHIAKEHLIPKQIKLHGLTKSAVKIEDEVIYSLIREYTSEAGVRNLERKIASVIRKSLCIMKTEGKKTYKVKKADLLKMLGAGVAVHKFDTKAGSTKVGVVNGMAWTSVGGVLLSIEVNVFEGTGKLEVTGLIGDVMKESATAAVSYIRSKASEFGLPADFYKTKDIHVHIPEGATPKDGPSAGVTLTTAILSALTGVPVKQNVAMTGEISIKGEVLAIGGLKEKSLAALKEGITKIIVPKENEADIWELPQAVKDGMEIVTAESIDTVFENAFAGEIKVQAQN